MGNDSDYVRDLIGEALSMGLADVMQCTPEDPVDHLGNWLLKYAARVEQTKQAKDDFLDIERRRHRAEKLERQKEEAELGALKEIESVVSALELCVEQGRVSDSYGVFSAVVELVVQWTGVQAAYVALLVSEAAEVVEEEEKTPISLENLVLFPDEPGEEAEPETEGSSAEGSDWKNWYVEIVAAADDSQSFLLHRELHRSGSQEVDDPSKLAPVFGLVDSGRECLYLRSCAKEKEIHFFAGYPKNGSCFMVPIRDSSEGGSPVAVLICDTLCPPGTGSHIKEMDQQFVKRVGGIASRLIGDMKPDRSTKQDIKAWTSKLKSEVDQIFKDASETSNPLETESEALDESQKELKQLEDLAKSCSNVVVTEEKVLAKIKDAVLSEIDTITDSLQREFYLLPTTLEMIHCLCQISGGDGYCSGSWGRIRNTVIGSLAEIVREFTVKEADEELLERIKKVQPNSDSLVDAALVLILKQSARLSIAAKTRSDAEGALLLKRKEIEDAETKGETDAVIAE